MDGDIAGVRIIPPVVEFVDAEANTVHIQTVSVQNISADSKTIKFHGPNTDKFKLIVTNPDRPVASGLDVNATVEFYTDDAQDYQDKLILLVDEDVIEIPLCVYSPQPLLELESPVEFGTVVRNNRVLVKTVTLYNHGSLPGHYKIQYTGEQPLTIFPVMGTLKPNTAQVIKVEFVAKRSGVLQEEAQVQLESQDPTTLEIKANVVERSLELLSPTDLEHKLDCITFGCTYYGTDKTEMAVLYNNSPDPVSFVAVLEEDAVGMEAGTDMTKSTLATLAVQNGETVHTNMNALTSMMSVIPNQGQLAPYQRMAVYFRFSPRYSTSKVGWKGTSSPPPRQDFALFMQFAIIGSSKGFLNGEMINGHDGVAGTQLEIALTGSALSVLLNIIPQSHFDFSDCPVGEHVDALCTLHNNSFLPAAYTFQPVAQFAVRPSSGKLKPGEAQDLIFTFKPNQYGSFKTLQLVEILGSVADDHPSQPPTSTHLEAIHALHISLSGISNPVSKKKQPKFNPGITPLVVGEVGQFVDVKTKDAKSYEPRAAMLGAPKTKGLHTTGKTQEDALVAYPNDRARSVRPSYRKEQYKTIFTKTDRHTYVDPDYAYTDEEMADVLEHKNRYNEYLKESREKRQDKEKATEFNELNNDKDIGVKPASGLRAPKLKAGEIRPPTKPLVPCDEHRRMLSSKQLANSELRSRARPCSGGLNAVPMTATEKADCKKTLCPQQLHQVIVGPPSIDFGEVCSKSTSVQRLSIVNNLEQNIHILVEIDCRELRQTSPLSQVVPPNCKAELPLIFETSTKGKFQRNVTYTLNGHHQDHVIVYAHVVMVALELSMDRLVLRPTPGLPAEAGLRDVITLRNKRNYPAEFTWQPILGERGTAFSIRPATGTVEAFKDLDCEVVFHPSYHAPEDGQFALQVHGGDMRKLTCFADLGPTPVMFMERRVLFGQVPLHLTTTRTAALHNNSQNHAYFQVVDPNPVPGLTVAPVHGVVPVGGNTELCIYLTPGAVMKFDTHLEVVIRGWKTIDLRMGGTVEPPLVDIDIVLQDDALVQNDALFIRSSDFKRKDLCDWMTAPTLLLMSLLGGVHCGSKLILPFKLVNRGRTRAKVVFDLSRFRDFSLKFDADVMEESEDTLNPGVYTVTVGGEQTINCKLKFQPTEVASYDFIMPVSINQTEAPTPDSTPAPPTPAPSLKSIQHIIAPRPVFVTIATPRRRIIATGLRQPLQLSHSKLDFSLPSGFLDLGPTSTSAQIQGTILVNNSDKMLEWSLDLKSRGKAIDEGIFRFVNSNGAPLLSNTIGESLLPGETVELCAIFCPEEPGEYSASVPIILNGDKAHPYQYLHLSGILKSPQFDFDPLAIVLTPVPLATKVSADFTINAAGFKEETVVDVELPEVELDDGSRLSVLSVTFPEGQTIQPCCAEEGHEEPFVLKCQVIFSSPRPVSFTQPIKFVDAKGNGFSIPVTATADNFLLTVYPFIAQHRTDYQIVTEQGHTALRSQRSASTRVSPGFGEAVLIPVESPSRPSTHGSTSSSSRFGATTSTYDESTDSVTESTYRSTPRDGAVNRADGCRLSSSLRHDSWLGLASRSLGSAAFPNEDTEEGIFHQEVLMAVQRWITLHGWAGGPFPVLVPDGLRSGVSKNSATEAARNKNSQSGSTSNSQKHSYTKTIYDLIAHLSGRPVPGIPINQSLPSDPTERVLQLHWQHSTLLTFLRNQGASVANMKPEYLFEPQDYQRWMKLQEQVRLRKKAQQQGKSTIAIKVEEAPLGEVLFASVSKRAWTDLILQTIKVLVLARITPRSFKSLPALSSVPLPSINPDPLCSNVYSMSERILLAWLNHHYEQQRHTIWKDCDKGGVPPSRWVVNFDYDLLDGLVLAAVVAAHVPYLIKSELQSMYTHPSTAEQCLHNALKVVNAFRHIGLDYDIQAIDITDPNPISLMLLCVHLYQRLPQHVPKTTVEFEGSLHATVTRQVRLTNPSKKGLVYHAMIVGHDARDFYLPKGNQITLEPKSKLDVSVKFTSRFLRPAEGVLVLVGRRAGAACGTTLVFNLRTSIDNITPSSTLKCESPCYELYKVELEVANLFDEGGDFRIVLVEAKAPYPGAANKVDQRAGLLDQKQETPKKVSSKVDHGQKKERTPVPQKVDKTSSDLNGLEENDGSQLNAFFCTRQSIYLESQSSDVIHVDFLPFHTGKKQCSILLINENLGEVLYSIEAVSTLPMPSKLPYIPCKHSVRITSAAAAGSGRGLYGGDDNVIYWRCDINAILHEELVVPITNGAREKALVVAAQQRMSDREVKRRQVTGTLASGSVTAAVAALRLNDDILRTSKMSTAPSGLEQTRGITFTVELNSKYFDAPPTLYVPSPLSAQPKSVLEQLKNEHKVDRSPAGLVGNSGVILDEGQIKIPIKFTPKNAGHYPCRVVLRSPNDIRVYLIECTVNPEGTAARIEFTAPVHQSVSQEIPVINQTNLDWPLDANIDGQGFFGPLYILAKAMQTTYYPLMFRPSLEALISGKLLLVNTEDGTEHCFKLKGEAQKPLALDHIVVECEARKSVKHVIRVPNVTSKKLLYRAVSDLSIMTGPPAIAVLPGKEEEYTVTLSPWKRGLFRGILSFIAGGTSNLKDDDSDADNSSICSRPNSNKRGESAKSSTSSSSIIHSEQPGYRVWYSVEVHCIPPAPNKIIDITCAAQSAVVMEVDILNPTSEELTFDTLIEGAGLQGDQHVMLMPGQKKMFQLVYAPAIVGKTEGTLIFQNPVVGEFWYALNLTAETPSPTVLPHIQCELGKWSRQFITLTNPTEETLELSPSCTNPSNFTLEVNCDKRLILAPHSTLEVPLQFMPSALGQSDHMAKISFFCEQLGEWIFMASGTGLTPKALDPVSVSATMGSNTSLIIPFRNPLNETILVDVILTDNTKFLEQAREKLEQNKINTDSAFCLLLKHTTNIPVSPKSTLDIPLTFAPDNMNLHEALCVVSVRREDGENWEYEAPKDPEYPTARRDVDRKDLQGGLQDIRWLYPIHGIPELQPLVDNRAVVSCRARSRIEERIEVSLTGAVPSSASGYRPVRTRAVTPKELQRRHTSDGIVVGEGNSVAKEFSYKLSFTNEEARTQLEHTVSLQLVRKQRDNLSGIVTLVFNVIYSPFKVMKHDVQLCVTASTGGVWRFPLRFVSSEPVADDTITIDSVGLKKESSVGFRLTSQARHPVAYNAYFVAGSDAEFTVSPQTGELRPLGTNGTLITVGFTPKIYGKSYQAKLVVQTAEMQWTYNIVGITPEYTPPSGLSSRPIAGPHPNPTKPSKPRNFLLENLRLNTTAVSSPIKGAPILLN